MKAATLLLLSLIFFCLPLHAQDGAFSIQTINDSVYAVMQGKSFKQDGKVARASLRYLTVLHYNAEGKVERGELVCHKDIAGDLIDIFRQLYKARYPIGRMRLIDNYGADDERSMADNNTSCFCYRAVAGTQTLSNHSKGRAIDINPLYNPYVKKRKDGVTICRPKKGKKYASRSKQFAMKIDTDDLCYKLFIAHGFKWGGAWHSLKDYQHFEKP